MRATFCLEERFLQLVSQQSCQSSHEMNMCDHFLVGIEIDRNNTVGDLKARVAKKTGISVANLRFICVGRAQEDNYVKMNLT
jgi:hypothetical protein